MKGDTRCWKRGPGGVPVSQAWTSCCTGELALRGPGAAGPHSSARLRAQVPRDQGRQQVLPEALRAAGLWATPSRSQSVLAVRGAVNRWVG